MGIKQISFYPIYYIKAYHHRHCMDLIGLGKLSMRGLACMLYAVKWRFIRA